MHEEQERAAFEQWYCADAERQGMPMPEGEAATLSAPAAQPGEAVSEDRMRKALTIIANWTLPETGKFWDEEKTRPTSFESEHGSNGARNYMRNLAGMALLAAPAQAAAVPKGWAITTHGVEVVVRSPAGEQWRYRELTGTGTDAEFIYPLLRRLAAPEAGAGGGKRVPWSGVEMGGNFEGAPDL